MLTKQPCQPSPSHGLPITLWFVAGTITSAAGDLDMFRVTQMIQAVVVTGNSESPLHDEQHVV